MGRPAACHGASRPGKRRSKWPLLCPAQLRPNGAGAGHLSSQAPPTSASSLLFVQLGADLGRRRHARGGATFAARPPRLAASVQVGRRGRSLVTISAPAECGAEIANLIDLTQEARNSPPPLIYDRRQVALARCLIKFV